MPTTVFHTGNLRRWVVRIRDRDPAARDELIRACQGRLETLVRRMLRRNPRIKRWAEDGDVFNGVAMRLLRALEKTPVADTGQFMNLAAGLARRELIDLARRFYGPRGVGTNHASVAPRDGGPPVPDPPAPDDPDDLDRWAALHEAIENLPDVEREVFAQRFYHNLTTGQVAELFGVSDREVCRRYVRAVTALKTALGARLPEA